MRAIRDELRVAKENRGAAVAVVVFTPSHAPSGVAPFTLVFADPPYRLGLAERALASAATGGWLASPSIIDAG